ncbi:hypothetical protein K1Y77_01980 [Halomonas qaidamensis]|uniref:Uncharacterized protein n=1 Tax=Halomonas qaidamensis TaxID=2866211 RepID=A0ABY6JSI2_9GAMM|nr:hypothetical protein [Halomonas qaidamensis]UYV19472.1 hypothetical protein K1Y77_01980 [Halomonas qaidamensis]
MSTDLPQAVPAIPRVPISRYRFTLRADTPFRLTGYPGAMLRGAWRAKRANDTALGCA